MRGHVQTEWLVAELKYDPEPLSNSKGVIIFTQDGLVLNSNMILKP